jgi:hypothetical protein
LLKWTRRAAAKGAEVFRDYARLRRNVAKLDPMKLQEHAKANRILKIMEIEQERIDSELHAYSTEAQRRLTAGEVR